MDRLLGIDPAMGNVGWALLEKGAENYFHYAASGVYQHGLKGKGQWTQKISIQVKQAVELLEYHPSGIFIEIPTYGSWGKNSVGALVRQMTTMEVAWRIAFEMRTLRPEMKITTIQPDRKSKVQRARMVMGLVRGWPEVTKDHETDAAWLVIRKA